jgi:hypothetical protein
MKKLLVLMLVLGMTSVASAALGDITLNAKGDLSGVTVDGTMAALDTEVFYILVVSEGTVSPLDGMGLGAAAPSMAGYGADSDGWIGTIPFTAGYTGGAWVMASAPGEVFKTGEYLNLGVAYVGQAWVEAWYFDEGSGATGFINSVLLPEPMTLALLGLGGLFMLRRRK